MALTDDDEARAHISFIVRLPVLSEQITDVHLSVSTAGSFVTIACSLAVRLTPSESVVVTTADRPSGIAATASEIAILKNESAPSGQLPFPASRNFVMFASHVTAQIARIPFKIAFPNASSFSYSGVTCSSVAATSFWIFPISEP
jgi:hypothetical protein